MQKLHSERAGKLIQVQSDYKCFVPNNLPPQKIEYSPSLIRLLSSAASILGELQGLSNNLPDKKIFVAMNVQKEAVLSSQIEGTQASLTDVLQKNNLDKKDDIEDIVNYVRALEYGIEEMQKLPLCWRLVKQMHIRLIDNSRGADKLPGEFRKSQNWIGPRGSTIKTATFIPPNVPHMLNSLSALEAYMQDEHFAPLIDIALINYQFETIHPFLDGNGRIGRLLISLWLHQQHLIDDGLLYLSYFFKKNRTEYYESLSDVRINGNYESWIKFFLQGVIITSEDAIVSINEILALKEATNKKLIESKARNLPILHKTVEYLYEHPFVNSKALAEVLDITRQSANGLLRSLEEMQILSLHSSSPQNEYVFDAYVRILERDTELD